MNTKHLIINGDSRQMNEISDKLVYFNLENRTFINAHLLKERLAEVDDTVRWSLSINESF